MRTVVLALLLLGLAAPAVAQKPTDMKEESRRRDQRLNDRDRYYAILDAYLAGDTRGSIDVLANSEWDRKRLQLLLATLDLGPPVTATSGAPGLAATTATTAANYSVHRWGAAVLLHMDVALRLSPTLESDQASWHLEFASGMVRLGAREAGREFRPLAERIYVALARVLVDRGVALGAERILRTARQRLPGGAAILGASALVAEALATDYALSGALVESRGFSATFQLDRIVSRRTARLNDATAWLREAVALDPGSDLLRVHLGRVLALGRHDEEAGVLLDAVRTSTSDDATAYLAAMFLGGLRERQQRFDEAAAAYRNAVERFPAGQAAAIASSHLLQRAGKVDEARAALAMLSSETAREPLWWYIFEPPGVSAERLDALRREMRR